MRAIIILHLQWKPALSPYIKAGIFAGTSVFIAEPLFAWLNIYVPLHWKYIYGLPIYFVIYLLADFMGRKKGFADLKREP